MEARLQRLDEMAAQPDADLAAVFIHEREQDFAVCVVGLAISEQVDESKRVIDGDPACLRRMHLTGASVACRTLRDNLAA